MFGEFCNIVSQWAVPVILLIIPVVGLLRRVKVYESFVEGAAEGFTTAIRIMPFLIAMMVAVGIFRGSGALDECIAVVQPVLSKVGIPAELIPLAVLRPLSGTGALGMTSEILSSEGPDSMAGRMASTLLGSTDTTLYILTVYFGAIGIRNPRYSLMVGLTGDLTGFIATVCVCKLIFGG
jgi:spore maturation protein B